MESNSDPKSDSSANSTRSSGSGPTPRPPRKRPSAEGGARGGRERVKRPREAQGAASSAAKREQRERRLESQRVAYRARVAASAGVALVLLIVCGVVYRSSAFSVSRVEVVGAKQLRAGLVRDAAKVPTDTTLLRLPVAEIQDRLKAHPWIAEATVQRSFPGTVRLTIVERQPAALVDTGEGMWLVDSSGYVMAKIRQDTTPTVAVVRDAKDFKPSVGQVTASATLLNALAVLSGISNELRAEVRTVSAPSVDETALMTKESVEVLIGAADELEKKDLIVRKILGEQRGKVVFIDVRATDRPVSRGLGE
jgi:cell division protein FtsQ